MNTLFSTPIVRFCLAKLEGLIIRLIDIFRLFPVRIRRIFNHFRAKILRLYRMPRHLFDIRSHWSWTVELLFYLIDLVGFGEIYEILAEIVKFNTRPLTDQEAKIVKEYFGQQINAKRVRIDEYAFGGPRTHKFAYVSFYTINSWGPMSEDTFVHELVHIWQYAQLGSVYIPRALSAQFSDEGYDYGGLASLMKAVQTGRGLDQFNLEQQGDIIADYLRIKQGRNPRWSLGDEQDLWVFEQLLMELKDEDNAIAV